MFAERPIYSSESEDSGGSDLDDARAKRLSKAKRLDDSDSDHKVSMLARKLIFAVQGQTPPRLRQRPQGGYASLEV